MEAAELNLFDLFAKISLDTSEYDSGVKDVTKSGESLASKLKSGLATAGKVAATGIGAITAAAGAAVGGLLALESATEEYRVAQGKLNTAFDAAGLSADAARESYYAFYGILGDTDTATEASQLLAKLVENEEDIVYWTDIAAGVYGTFGDSLPIEGLIEASNETAKVGTVTGALADALNWAGISEDEFNEKLAACTSESERNQLIMETLTATYDEAASAFYQNNQTLVQSRDAQTMLMDAMSKLGQTVSEVKTKLMGEFVPALANVATAFSDMLTGVKGADKEFSDAVGELVDAGVSKLPEFLGFGAQILVSVASGIVGSVPVLIQSIPKILQSFAESFTASLPSIKSTGAQLVSMIGEGITTGLPYLASSAVSIMSSLGGYLAANLPTMMQSGLEAASAFSASLRENAGLVIDGALSLAKSLAQGLADSIPTIVENVPEIVTNIAGVINDNAPKILAAGVEIVVTLVKGIINAIPTIIENIPQIINAIVNAILAFNWLNLGKTIITGLGNGIKAMISAIKDIAGQVVEAIKGGISALPQAMLNIGKNIVQGLWNGIQSMVGWIKDKVSGFVGGLVSGAKNLLGIHSPSTVFADMGKNMALGLGEGWDSQYGQIKRQIEGGMDFGTASVDFASSGLGVSSAGIVNGFSAAAQQPGGAYTFNLVLPTGEKLASYFFNPLVSYAKANGTPIVNPTG